MKAVFLPTIQHTGTWFCINLLLQHSQVTSFSELRDLKFGDGYTLIHTHFGDGETWHPNDASKFKPFYVVKELIGACPSVIPLRDPLASLITRHIRCPELQHSYIIEGFVALAQIYKENNFYVLPIDLYSDKSFEERLLVLREFLVAAGLPEESYIKFWAASWPIVNSVRGLDIELYDNFAKGKIEPIIKVIPEEWAYLKNKESILRPFLEELGYKNLLWWDK